MRKRTTSDQGQPSRPAASHAKGLGVARSGAELLARLQEAGGVLRVPNPASHSRAQWRRVIHALINGHDLPEGLCVRRHTGRDRGDLVIRLVDVKTLPSHSPDLRRLVDDGYDIEIRDSNLLVKHVPYVTPQLAIAYGLLVSELSTNGASTIRPRTHEVWFVGEFPCDNHGCELDRVINQRTATNFGNDLRATCSFSSKPPSGAYDNYYNKMTAYVRILSGFARAIDSTVTAQTYPAHSTTAEESVFRYLDAASSRAGISAISAKLMQGKVAIVGLGGTGSYILDLVAKTPVGEIHLYDEDTLYAHNAFRTPGATSLDELTRMPKNQRRSSIFLPSMIQCTATLFRM